MYLFVYLTLLAASRVVLSQAPNPLSPTYPDLATASFNVTAFILAVDKDDVQKLTDGYPLLPVPTSVFPNGFEAGKHPLGKLTTSPY